MIPFMTVLKLLHIAMGYGSRRDRLEKMLKSADSSVSMTTYSLVTRGYIDRITGTVNVAPK